MADEIKFHDDSQRRALSPKEAAQLIWESHSVDERSAASVEGREPPSPSDWMKNKAHCNG